MSAFLAWLEMLPTSIFVRESASLFAFPGFLFVHTLGVSIVAGGSAILALALIGVWPSSSLRPLERLYPIIWFGFWINLITGVGLLLADASTKGTNPVFWMKMVCVVAGVVLMARIRRQVFSAPAAGADAPVPAQAKVLAWASLVCWFGAIVAGRLIAYVGGGRG
jgi:hypothetical protein